MPDLLAHADHIHTALQYFIYAKKVEMKLPGFILLPKQFYSTCSQPYNKCIHVYTMNNKKEK